MRGRLFKGAFSLPIAGYDLVRMILGLLLAAALKGYQLVTGVVLSDRLLSSPWLLIATVEFELLFGFWLLSGAWRKLTWAASLACFGLFACVSLISRSVTSFEVARFFLEGKAALRPAMAGGNRGQHDQTSPRPRHDRPQLLVSPPRPHPHGPDSRHHDPLVDQGFLMSFGKQDRWREPSQPRKATERLDIVNKDYRFCLSKLIRARACRFWYACDGAGCPVEIIRKAAGLALPRRKPWSRSMAFARTRLTAPLRSALMRHCADCFVGGAEGPLWT